MIPGSRLILHDAAAFVLDVTLASDTSNFDLRSRAITAGWDQRRPLIANVKINSGVVLSANSTSVYAFDTGTTPYPAGSRLFMDTRSAFVIGMGGTGRNGVDSRDAQPGFAAGPAVRVNLATTWDNQSGTIGGGGGGGAGGGGSSDKNGVYPGGGGGGGRTGRTNAAGGTGYASGGTGTFSSAGNGGAGHPSGPAGDGGAGGGWGSAGGTAAGGPSGSSASGGAAGTAIVGNSNITWTNVGTRLGAIT